MHHHAAARMMMNKKAIPKANPPAHPGSSSRPSAPSSQSLVTQSGFMNQKNPKITIMMKIKMT